MFQSTRPRGARPLFLEPSRPTDWFQSTRPRGARLYSPPFHRPCSSFNPRARAGRDAIIILYTNLCLVSIHAPARGATAFPTHQFRLFLFQSTRPRGARHRMILTQSVAFVSIHAPARGATPLWQCYIRQGIVSIHAPARGATEVLGATLTMSAFQSTRPRGARPASLHQYLGAVTCFNPRARAGRDFLNCDLLRLSR